MLQNARRSKVIRRAKLKDADAVHAVLLTARDEIPLAPNFADDAHKTWVRNECRERRVWVFERDMQLAAVMVMAIMPLEEIFYLATVPTYRKQGVAEALVRDALARLWKKYRVTARARTRSANVRVVHLLEKLGFVIDDDMHTQPGWVGYRAQRLPQISATRTTRRTTTPSNRPRQNS
jgi:ribosomal protein S18 acetylase RimI-like enzyme